MPIYEYNTQTDDFEDLTEDYYKRVKALAGLFRSLRNVLTFAEEPEKSLYVKEIYNLSDKVTRGERVCLGDYQKYIDLDPKHAVGNKV